MLANALTSLANLPALTLSCDLLDVSLCPIHSGPAMDRPNEELFVISTEGRCLEGTGPGSTESTWPQPNICHGKYVLLTCGVEQRSRKRRKGATAKQLTQDNNMHSCDSDSSECEEPIVGRLKRSRLGRRALHRAKERTALPGGAGCDVERAQRGGVRDIWDAVDDPKEKEEEQIFLKMTGKNKPKVR